MVRGAAVDDLVDVVGDLGQRGDVGGGGLIVDRGGEFRTAGTELLGLLAQGGEPVGDHVLIEGAALERGEVAVNRGVDLVQFGVDRGEFGVAVGVACFVFLLGRADRIGDQGVLVAVEAAKCVEHGGVDSVGVEPWGVALAGVVAGAGEAGVIPVGFAPAGGAGAEHGFAALGAAHTTGEHVVVTGSGAVGVVFAAFGEDAFGVLERFAVDERGVAVFDGDAAEGQLTDVDAVGEHP